MGERRWRLALTLVLAFYGWRCLRSPEAYRWLDSLDLAIHEIGHLVFAFGGELLTLLGGTLLQLMVPAAFVVALWRQGDHHGATVPLWWLGQHCWNISVYVRDARAQQLPLVGAGEHDWAILLGQVGWLQRDHAVGRAVWLAGVVFYGVAVVLGCRFLYPGRRPEGSDPSQTRRLSTIAEQSLNRIAALGLLVGAAFGLAGTFVGSPHLQASLWAIDSIGLVIATTLLALKCFRDGADVVAGGFLVFAIGEGVLLSGTAAGPMASVPAFAAGTALWAAALVLISAPRQLPLWLRLLGGVAACLFAITAARIYAGEALLPTSSPLPFFAYPVLGANLPGWAWMLVREKERR